MKAKTWQRALLWLLTLLTAALIYWFSSQTAAESSALSGEVTQGMFGKLFMWLQISEELQYTVHGLVRSAAHIGIFAALGLFSSLLTRSYTARLWVPISGVSCGVYAVLDECHQLWVAAGRAFELTDVFKDIVGVFLGIALVALLCWLWKKREGT